MVNKLTLALFLGTAYADQPVHCLREKIYGMWEFHVSKDVDTVNLFEAKEICSHQMTNKVQILSQSYKFQFEKEEVWKVSLEDQYRAEATCTGCESGAGSKVTGKWSPVYAQGMMVELDNGLRFVSNFRYNLKSSISEDPANEKDVSKVDEISRLSSDSLASFDSVCS